jgi:magnesium transporter
VWIGLQQPKAEDIAVVAKEFGLPPMAVEDAVKAHQRAKLEVYRDVVFVVLKPVHYIDHDEVVHVTERAIFLGPKFVVVTVQHG